MWSDQLFSRAVFVYICSGTVQCKVYTVYTHQSRPVKQVIQVSFYQATKVVLAIAGQTLTNGLFKYKAASVLNLALKFFQPCQNIYNTTMLIFA